MIVGLGLWALFATALALSYRARMLDTKRDRDFWHRLYVSADTSRAELVETVIAETAKLECMQLTPSDRRGEL